MKTTETHPLPRGGIDLITEGANVLAPGFEPGSRSNPELTGYKPAALPLCYAKKLSRTDIPVCPISGLVVG